MARVTNLTMRMARATKMMMGTLPAHPGTKFSGEHPSLAADPLYRFKTLSELYKKAGPDYSGPFSVPVLWDKKTQDIVNNESSEIIRMLATEFDHLIPDSLREANRPGGGLYPIDSRVDIDALNEWVDDGINDGVYKTGFALTQEAYDQNVYPLFEALDRIEEILFIDHSEEHRFLIGEHLTEADVRLYVTIVRFDVAYHPAILCNHKSIRHDYPNIHMWLRRLFWSEYLTGSWDPYLLRDAFRKTTTLYMRTYLRGYALARWRAVLNEQGPFIVPNYRLQDPGRRLNHPRTRFERSPQPVFSSHRLSRASKWCITPSFSHI